MQILSSYQIKLLQLSIIIVNYNVKHFLEQCLYAVEKACGNIDAEVFVVDNASHDGSKSYFEGRFPEVRFSWLDKNVGFAKANNIALAKTRGEYVLFLNPDTIVAEDTFLICLGFAAKQGKFGALGVHMIDGSGHYLPESKRMFPSLSASFFKMSGITSLFPRSAYISKYYAAHLPENQSGQVEVLAGAYMLVSREALNITHGFDEDFFMYGEDIDLSYRITKAGFTNFYCGDTSVIHFKGESVQKTSGTYLKNFYGAMLLFEKKHSVAQRPHVKAAILGAYALASFKRSMQSPNDTQSRNKGDAMAFVAGQDRFNTLLQIIKLSVDPFLIKGRIAVDPEDEGTAIGSLADIKTVVKKSGITHLVLAEGELSFKKIIALMIAHKGLVTFLIQSNNSKSMVGSDDKNRPGFYFADPL